jgi:metal-dependent amidase/aminoacylase/carboxypeptidase family protein
MGHYENPNDPVIVLAQLINSIQSIVSRNLSAFDEAVVTIGQIFNMKLKTIYC